MKKIIDNLVEIALSNQLLTETRAQIKTNNNYIAFATLANNTQNLMFETAKDFAGYKKETLIVNILSGQNLFIETKVFLVEKMLLAAKKEFSLNFTDNYLMYLR